MNLRFLIDSIVQQTTVLVAQLATTGGVRAPLAHLVNEVFLELTRELDELGVTRKVAADMFGLALRSYRAKVARLEESATGAERLSLWQAVFEHVRENGPLKLQEILGRFHYDDEASVRGILYDLTETGLLSQSGAGDHRIYRETSAEDFNKMYTDADPSRVYWTAWMVIYRNGPLTRGQLDQQMSTEDAKLDAALERLIREGQVELRPPHGSNLDDQSGERDVSEAIRAPETVFVCHDCFIPAEDPAGWEAAVFDHFNAVTSVLTTRLRQLQRQTLPGEWVGGSTYTFDVWDSHPLSEEVTGLLQRHRAEISELNGRVRAHNASTEPPAEESIEKVLFYFGQTVLE